MVTMTDAETTLGRMLQAAMACKSKEIGRDYSYRDLEADSNVTHTYPWKIINEGQNPKPEIIRDLATALAPYFPLNAALVAAGYVPDGPERENVQRFLALPFSEQIAALEHRAHLRLVEPSKKPDADDEPENKRRRSRRRPADKDESAP